MVYTLLGTAKKDAEQNESNALDLFFQFKQLPES